MAPDTYLYPKSTGGSPTPTALQESNRACVGTSLSSVEADLLRAYRTLTVVHEKLHGPVPESANKEAPSPMGLMSALDRLQRLANTVANQAEALNETI